MNVEHFYVNPHPNQTCFQGLGASSYIVSYIVSVAKFYIGIIKFIKHDWYIIGAIMKFPKQSRFIIGWEFTSWAKLYIIMNKIQYLIISSSRESIHLIEESITHTSFDTQRFKKWYSLLVGISTVIKIFYHFPISGRGL